jgi:UDP-N-acetylmuramoylalanine-D-glutamate ligase
MKVIVCGGREYRNERRMFDFLDRRHAATPISQVIHGGARGADSIALLWATARKIPARCFPADWKAYGKAAGSIRNTQMLAVGAPDLVVAFPGGPGTHNMVSQAAKAGVAVEKVDW